MHREERKANRHLGRYRYVGPGGKNERGTSRICEYYSASLDAGTEAGFSRYEHFRDSYFDQLGFAP